MSTSGDRETEIKLVLTSAEQGLALLTQAGFVAHTAREFESNTLVDTPDAALRTRGEMLRVRHVAGHGVLTYKGPAQAGKHKSREELESIVTDSRLLIQILERLGYRPVFRYEKYRTEFTRPGEVGTALLDETPIGAFLELEGESAWIDATAALLGFQPADYNTASYGSLYLEHCRQQGITPTHMVFGA